MQKFVKIRNRNSYTNVRKAWFYVDRGLAKIISASDDGSISEIDMLEAAELESLKNAMRRVERDPVGGSFTWFVGESGGSAMMKAYTGVSGGMRGYQAQHGLK